MKKTNYKKFKVGLLIFLLCLSFGLIVNFNAQGIKSINEYCDENLLPSRPIDDDPPPPPPPPPEEPKYWTKCVATGVIPFYVEAKFHVKLNQKAVEIVTTGITVIQVMINAMKVMAQGNYIAQAVFLTLGLYVAEFKSALDASIGSHPNGGAWIAVVVTTCLVLGIGFIWFVGLNPSGDVIWTMPQMPPDLAFAQILCVAFLVCQHDWVSW